MPLNRRNLLCCFGLLALSGLAAGCVSGASGGFGRLVFWEDPPDNDIRTRATRLSELKELAEETPRMEASQRESLSLELAQGIRSETDALVRAQVMRTLAGCGTQTADRVIEAGLKDSDSVVRIAACEAIGRRGGTKARENNGAKASVDALAEVLQSDTDVDVRLAAARALGEIKDPAVVAALAPALDDSNPALQYRAVKSLESSTGKQFGDDASAWRQYVAGETPQVKKQSLATRWWSLF